MSRKRKKSWYIKRRSRFLQKSLHKRVQRWKNHCKYYYSLRLINRRKVKEKYLEENTNREYLPERLPVPKDFRLIYNTKQCALFFRDLLNMKRVTTYSSGQKQIYIDLQGVENIDFAATLMLNSICEELSDRECNIVGNTPKNSKVHNYLIDSGFFNEKFDLTNRKMIVQPGNSKIVEVQRGEGRMKKKDLVSLADIVDKTLNHLGDSKKDNRKDYVGILKEICGNSIEWGNVLRQNWTIGVKFEDDKVIFVALDMGIGILRSLDRKKRIKLSDAIQGKDNCDILHGVFDSYYGSRSKDPNRNQGLPYIKDSNARRIIKNLCVVTNNVLINFSDSSMDKEFSRMNRGLQGTLYTWDIDLSCL